ncbi:MAG: hypothetical protein ACTHOG_09205 [Marmoricola sp.]
MNLELPAVVRRAFRRRAPRVAAIVVAIVLVLVAGSAIWARWWREQHPSGLLGAITTMPVATQRLGFTDWSAVRLELRVYRDAEVSTMSSWLQRAFEADLSPTSVMAPSGPALQKTLGFSPANAQWEAYGQAPNGQVEVVRLNDTVDFDGIRSLLRKAGYTAPKSSTGAWTGGTDVLASIDPSISAEFSNLVLLPDQHLVLASSLPSYLAMDQAVVAGKQKALSSVDSVSTMLNNIDEPAAAVVWTRDFVCADLAMSNADADSQAQAQRAISAAGQITPLVGFTLALDSEGVLTAAEQFTSASVAQGDLKARASLAIGPEYGRGPQNFSDDFTLESASTKNSTILLTMQPKRSGVFPLSSLYSGPLVFATC